MAKNSRTSSTVFPVVALGACTAVSALLIQQLLSHTPAPGPAADAPEVAGAGPAHPISFNRDIRPILSDNCYFCHGPDSDKREAELRLDIREEAISAGAIVAGDPDESELVHRIYTTDPDDIMPHPDTHKVLTDNEKALLSRWIEEGAEYQAHWAYEPIRRPEVAGIDTIVATTLKREGLAPAPQADRRTLIRRVSLDVTGLPPSPADVAAFVNDDSPTAYERVVDRLLASQHYGEKMAIHWLDAVRYADTVGYHGDQLRDASPYRDYVIEAFNINKPFDAFTTEQIAGDMLPGATLKQRIAASYNRLNQISQEGGIQDKEYVKKYQAERVRTLSTTWLGSTMACCECHDHKFDPFTTKDFYSMAAFFADLLEKGAWNGDGRYQEDAAPYLAPEEIFTNKRVRDPQLKVSDAVFAFGGDTNVTTFRSTPASISAKPRVVRILPRGNWMDETGEIVSPATPHFLPGYSAPSTNASERATRLDLAQWLVSPENPLVSRAFVNRLWAQFFGTALSRAAEDLGLQGEYPVHPEVLDWLAAEFIASGWDVKHTIKTIVMSRTYRQSSDVSPALEERDPYNRLLARQRPRRLPAELIRDNALAISGLLNPRIGGSSVRPYQPAGYYQHLNFPKRTYQPSAGDEQYRRGVYTHWQRTFLHPMLVAFDAPARDECAVSRPNSNTPLQALNLLNDPSFVEAAQALARRVLADAADDKGRIAQAFELALARPPRAAEAETLAGYLLRERERLGNDASAAAALASTPDEDTQLELAVLTSMSRAILNLHETITRY